MALVRMNNAKQTLSNGILVGSLFLLFDRLKPEDPFALPCRPTVDRVWNVAAMLVLQNTCLDIRLSLT